MPCAWQPDSADPLRSGQPDRRDPSTRLSSDRGSFSSVKELIAKIEQFVAAYNKTKALFNWIATADSILEKLQRLCSQISGTAH